MRIRLAAILLCALTFSEAAAQPPQPPELTCENLKQCLTLLQKPYPCMPDCPGGDPLDYEFIHDQGGYFSLPVQFEKFGRPGVLALLELLKQPNLSIRARAGMVLGALSALTPADIPAILQESRNGWIVSALARINSPEALSELISLLKKPPDLQTQHGSALKSLANKAMPLLLEALSCKTDQDCSTDFVRAIGELASEPGIQSDQIRDRLIDLATTREQFTDTRVGALQALAWLKPTKETDRSRIRILLNDPEAKVRDETKAALVAWPDEMAPLLEPSDCAVRYTQYNNSGNIVSKGCQTYSEFPRAALKEDRLRYIGALGPAGRTRTPYVLELLKDDDWGVRAEAARTLGLMGETSAIPYLIDAISARDWKLTFEAMTSLQKLQAPQARGILKEIAGTYWQSGIRAAARRLVDGKPEPTVPGRGWKYWSPIDAYCGSGAGEKEASKPGVKLSSHPDLFGAREIGQTVTVDGGTLVAINKGEWGGALEFRPDSRLLQQLLHTQEPIEEETVFAVVKSQHGIFALTGSGHMGLVDGFIYKVEKIPDGKWKGRIIWRLPGAPRRAIVSPAGTLGIQTDYGDVIFRPDNGIEWISCPVKE